LSFSSVSAMFILMLLLRLSPVREQEVNT
jgi:hypothetical protein